MIFSKPYDDLNPMFPFTAPVLVLKRDGKVAFFSPELQIICEIGPGRVEVILANELMYPDLSNKYFAPPKEIIAKVTLLRNLELHHCRELQRVNELVRKMGLFGETVALPVIDTKAPAVHLRIKELKSSKSARIERVYIESSSEEKVRISSRKRKIVYEIKSNKEITLFSLKDEPRGLLTELPSSLFDQIHKFPAIMAQHDQVSKALSGLVWEYKTV